MRWTTWAFCAAHITLVAQVSPYTGVALQQPDSAGRYRLLIGGHFHGESTNVSGYPASTVLAGIDSMNALAPHAMLSAGDLFMEPDRDSARYVRSLFSRLRFPLFNAPGNHDREGRAYRVTMPQVLVMGRDRIVLLDTERDDSDLVGDQLAVFRDLVDISAQGGSDRIFIISHRPVWAEDDARYGRLFEGNTRSMAGCNYRQEVLPLVRRLAETSEVYWISGSVAGRAPASVFFQPHEKNITYIQCAVRDRLYDALLVVDVDPGSMRWSVLSLTGQPTRPVSEYGAAWWEREQGAPEEFEWRRIPYLIKKSLMRPEFWYGVLSSLLLVSFGMWWRGRARRK